MKLLPRRSLPMMFLCATLAGFGARLEAADNAPVVLSEIVVTPTVQTDFSLGTSTYSLNRDQIDTFAQGSNSTFNQVMLRTPGASQESSGQVHFRQEDPYYQYYINGILLPRAINGFGEEIDTRFVDSVTFKVGALPAQYAWGNYGIVSIQTKEGGSLKGGEASIYGGSYNTVHPAVSCGGSSGKTDYFFTGSYLHNSLGLENPTSGARAIHDNTDQYRGLAYASQKLTDTSSLSFIFSGFHGDFQIPNNPGQTSIIEFAENAASFPSSIGQATNSARLNETQTEQSYYGILAYQQTLDNLSFQIAQVNRYSSVLFRPDIKGDLYFNGVASRVFRDIMTNGIQADCTCKVDEANTVREGVLFDTAGARAHNQVHVFAAESDDVDPANGEQIAKAPPVLITDNHFKRGYDFTVYLQDEYKYSDRLTINFGGRFDQVNAYVHEKQISPRISAVYQASAATTFHAGYARYFIPPPLENVSPTSVDKFFGKTTNSPDVETDDPVKCERSHYFDAGVTHNFLPEFQIGLNGYYKRATDQLDDGQFGTANIFSPYNYSRATIYGVELAASYTEKGFSAYGNFAISQAKARNIISSQFEFDADELAYVATHDVYRDQTQFFTGSAGVSYAWTRLTAHADFIYGSGQRRGFANTRELPGYYPVNLGLEYRVKLRPSVETTIRLDVINLFDQSYAINDGTGIGIGAPKFGARRGIYGGISCAF